ncbi:MAG: FtsX-like permease family protein [Bacteroidales bacterium]|nr:FtsX-like permease family protein [Bacteroidales bacterium]
MIKQLFKIVWKQRKYNSLLLIEIIFSFVALFLLSAVCIHYWKRYNEPIGINNENIWILETYQAYDTPPDQVFSDSVKFEKMDQIRHYIKTNYPEVVSCSKVMGSSYPYSNWISSDGMKINNREIFYHTSWADPELYETFGLKLTEGRWIEEGDRFSDIQSVVINEKMRNELFGNKPAAGKTIIKKEWGDSIGKKLKILGVFTNMKKEGEFTAEPNFAYYPNTREYYNYSGIAMKFNGSLPTNFEPRLIKDLSAFNKTYIFRLESLEKMRQNYIIRELSPVIIIGAIVLFLVVNVMLGLFGTLWLNISRRKPEIGLRRAVGSTGPSVLWQILGETYVLAIISVLLGLVLTSQVFIFNVYNTPVSTLIEANMAAFLIILLLCTISALAPAKQAARLEPAQALHEE